MIVKLVNLNVSGYMWIVLDVKRELLVCCYYKRADFPSDNILEKYFFRSLKYGGKIIKQGYLILIDLLLFK
jgi:hypothetical protein